MQWEGRRDARGGDGTPPPGGGLPPTPSPPGAVTMRADHSTRGARPVAPWAPSLRPSGSLGLGGALQRPAPVEASGAMAPPSAVDAAAREVGVTVGGPARAGRADSAPETQRDHSVASTVADGDEVELGGGSQASRCAGFVQAASAVLRSGRPGAAAVAERLSLQRALSAVQARLAGDPPAEGPRCALGSWARGLVGSSPRRIGPGGPLPLRPRSVRGLSRLSLGRWGSPAARRPS